MSEPKVHGEPRRSRRSRACMWALGLLVALVAGFALYTTTERPTGLSRSPADRSVSPTQAER